jgi:hypothetical protein
VRRLLALLLLVAPASAEKPAVTDEARNFEVSVPEGSEDWDLRPPDGDDTRAYFRTVFADTGAIAEVRVMVYAVSEKLASKDLAAIVAEWAPGIESRLAEPRTVAEGKATLGGEEACFRDVRGGDARLTWHLARRGRFLYVFHVLRMQEAVEDADVEEQVAKIRGSFRLLKGVEPDAVPPEPPPIPDKIPAALLARATLKFEYWRFECVKPEGLVHVPPEKLDAAERDSGVVAKFERTGGPSTMMVRIYARAKSTQKFTIEELAKQKLKRFEEAYDEARRKTPVRDDAWKFPMAEKAIRLELTGRRTAVQVTRWYLAQCRNGRQYQIEIFVAGDGDEWAAQVRDVVEGFRSLPE